MANEKQAPTQGSIWIDAEQLQPGKKLIGKTLIVINPEGAAVLNWTGGVFDELIKWWIVLPDPPKEEAVEKTED